MVLKRYITRFAGLWIGPYRFMNNRKGSGLFEATTPTQVEAIERSRPFAAGDVTVDPAWIEQQRAAELARVAAEEKAEAERERARIAAETEAAKAELEKVKAELAETMAKTKVLLHESGSNLGEAKPGPEAEPEPKPEEPARKKPGPKPKAKTEGQ